MMEGQLMRFWEPSTRDGLVAAWAEKPTGRRRIANKLCMRCISNHNLCPNIQTMTCDGSDEEGGA